MKAKIAVIKKTKLNKWFILGIIFVIVITSTIIAIGIKNSYDYIFIVVFSYLAIKALYYKYYLE